MPPTFDHSLYGAQVALMPQNRFVIDAPSGYGR